MNPVRFIREVAGASHYRRKPSAVLKYAYAKWVYFRFRQNDPVRFLKGVGVDLHRAMQGFERWRPMLEQVISSVHHEDGCQGGISLADGLVLYGLVRALRPDFVVETGVAAGVSTSFLGAALIENGLGEIYSIELPPAEALALPHPDGSRYAWQEHGVGWAIPGQIRLGLADRHHLILRDVRSALPELLETIPQVDLFFHDDLHTPDHMIWEYEMVWPRLSPGGVLVSDDVNHGWIKFCKSLGLDGTAFQNVNRLCALRKAGKERCFSGRKSFFPAAAVNIKSEELPGGNRTVDKGNQP